MTPLLGIGLCVSIQFGALEWSKRLFAAQNARSGRGGPGGATLSSGQLFLAGSFAGLANGVVSGPVEHIRISECSFCPRLSCGPCAPLSNTRGSAARNLIELLAVDLRPPFKKPTIALYILHALAANLTTVHQLGVVVCMLVSNVIAWAAVGQADSSHSSSQRCFLALAVPRDSKTFRLTSKTS